MFLTPRIRCAGAARVRVWAFCGIAVQWAIGIAYPGQHADMDDARVSVAPTRVVKPGTTSFRAIRLDVRLVLVPVTVTDPFGASVSGLHQSAFHVFENGVEQKLTYFASDDTPVSLGVVFDASKSMEGKLDKSRAAVSQVFRTSMPGDEFFAVEFNDSPRILHAFTTDTEQIEKSLAAIKPRNWTSLFDAVYLAIHEMKRARHQRKALLIVSDGADNASRFTEAEMLRLVREADVCIYSIGLTGGSILKRHTRTLKRLAEGTGGLLAEVERLEELPEAVAKLNRAIRNQYLLGFSFANGTGDGLFRKIVVKLDQDRQSPPLRASWREGYYAPAEP